VLHEHEGANKCILKALKKNAFKLNNKKIERVSTFQQFLQQTRQHQQQQ
jgi:hypothetical protein